MENIYYSVLRYVKHAALLRFSLLFFFLQLHMHFLPELQNMPTTPDGAIGSNREIVLHDRTAVFLH